MALTTIPPSGLSTSDTFTFANVAVSGNVGIGTSSPRQSLDVAAGKINIGNTTIGHTGSGGDWGMAFDTYSGGYFERMRITSEGNVGIGTNSPVSRLAIANGGVTIGGFQAGSGSNLELGFDGTQTIVQGYDRTGNSYLPVWIESSLTRFGVGGSERMRIDSSGDVGIGTTGPSGWRVNASSPSANKLRLFNTAGNGNIIDFLDQSWQAQIEGIAGNLVLRTGGTAERMRIDNSGNVGIGTSTPGYRLEVNGSFAATSKSFLIDHPTRPGMKLRHGSLEGPEHGVYVRGKIKGRTIELPEYWTKLVDPDSITVQLTAIGRHQRVYVSDIRDNKVYIENEHDIEDPHCFYLIQAERVDVDKMQVEIE
jgi:hypothetical protein